MKDEVTNLLQLANLVRENVRAKQLFTPYNSILVTLSGGQDSVCSLLLLYLLQNQLCLEFEVASRLTETTVQEARTEPIVSITGAIQRPPLSGPASSPTGFTPVPSFADQELRSARSSPYASNRSVPPFGGKRNYVPAIVLRGQPEPAAVCSRVLRRALARRAQQEQAVRSGLRLTRLEQLKKGASMPSFKPRSAQTGQTVTLRSNVAPFGGLTGTGRRLLASASQSEERAGGTFRPPGRAGGRYEPLRGTRRGFSSLRGQPEPAAVCSRVLRRAKKEQAVRSGDEHAAQRKVVYVQALQTRASCSAEERAIELEHDTALGPSVLVSPLSQPPAEQGIVRTKPADGAIRNLPFLDKSNQRRSKTAVNLDKCPAALNQTLFDFADQRPVGLSGLEKYGRSIGEFGLLWCNHFWQKESFYTMLHVAKINLCFSSTMCFYLPIESVFCEQNAREWRHKSIQRTCAFYHYECCTQGHTKSDRVETILFNILRGTGIAGLQSLQWKKTFYSFSCQRFYPCL